MSKIREARTKLGLTQQQLANLTGIPFRTIQNWEGGQRKCPDYVEKLLLFYIENAIKKELCD
jgi:DNA-binding transcriptional regulator YiaG